VYFRHDLRTISAAWWRSVLLRRLDTDASVARGVPLATVPAGLVGLLFKGVVEANLRSPPVIATTTVVFAILLWVVGQACP